MKLTNQQHHCRSARFIGERAVNSAVIFAPIDRALFGFKSNRSTGFEGRARNRGQKIYTPRLFFLSDQRGYPFIVSDQKLNSSFLFFFFFSLLFSFVNISNRIGRRGEIKKQKKEIFFVPPQRDTRFCFRIFFFFFLIFNTFFNTLIKDPERFVSLNGDVSFFWKAQRKFVEQRII